MPSRRKGPGLPMKTKAVDTAFLEARGKTGRLRNDAGRKVTPTLTSERHASMSPVTSERAM